MTPASLAAQAAALLAVDPSGFGGAQLRARPGPHLEEWIRLLRSYLGPETPFRRLPARIDPQRLTGEVDVVETLRTGTRTARPGLLAAYHGGILLVPMAERMEPEQATLLGQVLDTGRVVPRAHGLEEAPSELGLVLLDESREDEMGPPALLTERLGILLALEPTPASAAGAARALVGKGKSEGGGAAEPGGRVFTPEEVDRARQRLPEVTVLPELADAVVHAALALGIPSLRPPLAAVRVARASAALHGRTAVADDDLALAAALVLMPRRQASPEEPAPAPEPEDAPPPPPPSDEGGGEEQDTVDRPLADRVLEAARARLPEGFEVQAAVPVGGRAGRKGALIRQLREGYRVGARPGDPRKGGSIDLAATLTTAAPWQRARKARGQGHGGRVVVVPSDLHVQIRARRSATASIFVVDASGSQALHRLAEVKGAVELLLADSYVRREEVALVTFRGRDAEVVLPPTRSLVRARRALAGLPGGGGTPLARGLMEGLRVAMQLRASEATPRIILLSDGRPNVDREGEGGRANARKDALAAARLVADAGIPLLILDTSNRGEAFAAELSRAGAGRHLHLPRADARTVRSAIAVLEG